MLNDSWMGIGIAINVDLLYFVYYDNSEEYQLINPKGSVDKEVPVMYGQLTHYRESDCVSIEEGILIAETYLNQGKLLDRYVWCSMSGHSPPSTQI